MASGISRTRSPFTLTWTINNLFKHSLSSLRSAEFVADSINKTKWSLTLLIPGWNFSTPGHLICILQREKGENEGIGDIYIDFQLAILDDTGLVLRSVREEGCRFGMPSEYAGDTSYRVRRNLIQIRTFVENLDKYVPNNTLTLRCRMWKFGCIISRTELCFARTVLDTEKRSFIWTIEQVCIMSPGQKRSIHVPCYSRRDLSLQLNFILKQNFGEEVFSIEMHEVKDLRQLYYKISMMNSEGKIIDSRGNKINNITSVDKKCLLFHNFFKKRDLIEDQKHLLTNGTLILQCDFQFLFGFFCNQIENYRQESSEIAAVAVKEETGKSSIPCHLSCSSKKVLEYLLNEGTLSDLTLRAGSKCFPVHKNILSAKSLVFRSMFLKDKMQTPSKIVDLSDIDEITLRSLLQYIYTDVVEDLDFGKALELYQSADKYQLMDLKKTCTKFLTVNLSRSNIFQILSFASVYQDSKMKKAAQDFISSLGNEFTASDEWQDFKKRNLELAMETMEYMFSRKRMKTEN